MGRGRVRYYPNKHPGECERCGQTVPAGQGRVRRDGYGGWVHSHPEKVWVGSPVSGRFDGGCPPRPAEPEPDAESGAAERERDAAVRAARVELYRRLFASSDPPRYRDPGTELGRDRLTADMLRLAAMTPNQMAADADAMATFFEIVAQQGWDR